MTILWFHSSMAKIWRQGVRSLFCYALLSVLSSFVIILTRKRELFALLYLSCWCLVTVNVLPLFLLVLWVGLQCVIVVFPDHSHLLFPQ